MAINRTEERIELTAVDKASQTINQVKGSVLGLKTGLDSVHTAMGAVGSIVGAGAMLELFSQVNKATAALNDMAESTGASVENLSKLQTIARIGGHDFGGLTDGIGRMIKGLKGANEEGQAASHALDFLGVKAKDNNGRFRDSAEVLMDVAKALQQYEDDGNKVALVQDLLGRRAGQYLPLLKDMAEEGGVHARTLAHQAEEADKLEKNIARLAIVFEDQWLPTARSSTSVLKEITDNLVSANQHGRLFFQTMIEGAKALAVSMTWMKNIPAWMPGPLGMAGAAGRAADVAATALFEFDERQRTLREGPNLWNGAAFAGPTGSAGSSGYNSPARAGAGPRGKTAAESLREAEWLAQKQVELEEMAAQDSREAWQFYTDGRIADEKRIADEQERNAKEMESWQRRQAEIYNREIDRQIQQAERLEDALTQGVVDGLMRGFERGESIAKNFLGTLKNLFATTVLTAAIQPVMKPVSSFVTGAVQGLGNSIFGGGGGMFNPTSLMGNSFSLDYMSGMSTGLFADTATTAAMIESGTAGFAGAGIEAAGLGGGMAGFGAALPWVGAGLFAASALGLFDEGGGPKPSELGILRHPSGHYYVSQNNVPGGDGNMGLYNTLNARLNDPSQFDAGVLGGLTGYIGGAPGEGAQAMFEKLIARLEPARQAAMLKAAQEQQDAARKLQDAADRQTRAAELQIDLARREEAIAQQVRALPESLGINTLEQYGASLRSSEYLAPLDRLSGARSNYDALLSRARGGDLSAVQEFPDAAQSLLGIGRDVYASSPAFQNLFREVNLALNQMLEQQRGIQTDILRSVPVAIQQAAVDQIGELRRGFAAMVSELQAVQAEVRFLREAA